MNEALAVLFVLQIVAAVLVWISPKVMDDLGCRMRARAAATVASREVYKRTYESLRYEMEERQES